MSRLSRWSRRKLGEQADDIERPESVSPAGETVPEAAGVETPTSPPPEPGSLDASLPDPDTLPAGSDFTAFLKQGVSDGLRRRALRRMFSGKHYGIRDGLDDYDDDYRARLKPLTSEVARRLRQWTRQPDETEAQAPGSGDAAEIAEHEAPRTREAAPAADQDADVARQADEVATEPGASGRA